MQRANSDLRAVALGIAPYHTDEDWQLDSDADQDDANDTNTDTGSDTDDQGGEEA